MKPELHITREWRRDQGAARPPRREGLFRAAPPLPARCFFWARVARGEGSGNVSAAGVEELTELASEEEVEADEVSTSTPMRSGVRAAAAGGALSAADDDKPAAAEEMEAIGAEVDMVAVGNAADADDMDKRGRRAEELDALLLTVSDVRSAWMSSGVIEVGGIATSLNTGQSIESSAVQGCDSP